MCQPLSSPQRRILTDHNQIFCGGW